MLLSSTFACSQSNIVLDIEDSYIGVIVNRDVDFFVDAKNGWFKPTLKEIKKAEQLLADNIRELNREA